MTDSLIYKRHCLNPSQVWPWKATEVRVQGQCKTESDPIDRKGKMNKTKIKVSIKWFNQNSGAGVGKGEEEEGKEKKAGQEVMEGENKEGKEEDEGKEDEQPEKDLGDGKKKTKKKREENDKDTLVIHCNQAARSFACPLCQDEIKHKFVSGYSVHVVHYLIKPF